MSNTSNVIRFPAPSVRKAVSSFKAAGLRVTIMNVPPPAKDANDAPKGSASQ